MRETTDDRRSDNDKRAPWSARSFSYAWLFGAALLALVVGASLHVSGSHEFIVLAERAGPWWMGLALLLQLETYVAQGAIWRNVAAAAAAPLQRTDALALSLAKLFADQALPSAGISGSLVVARALRGRGMRDEAVNAAVLINVASYHIAYVVALGVALTILIARHRANALIVATSVLFVAFAVAVIAAATLLSGRPDSRLSRRLQTITALRGLLDFMGRADSSLARSVRLLRAATTQQIAIIAADAGTMWVLLRSIGVNADIEAVFASFMVSSLVRTLGVVPGGLGTFEATSVITLTITGATVAEALSATLLFRGLSFWIPMLPGLWAARHLVPTERRSSDDHYVAGKPRAGGSPPSMRRRMTSSTDGPSPFIRLSTSRRVSPPQNPRRTSTCERRAYTKYRSPDAIGMVIDTKESEAEK